MTAQKGTHSSARLVVSLFLLSLAGASGQINEGTILGTIRDATGALVVKAQVAVTNIDTNVGASTTTNDTGDYIVKNLVPGRYTVVCQHVVGVGFVSEAEDRLALFGKGRRFGPLPAGSIAQ